MGTRLRKREQLIKSPMARISEISAGLLRQRGWASRIPAEVREALISELAPKRLMAGETITLGGSTGGHFWALIEGQVGAFAAHATAGAPLAHVLLPGAWWGAGPLIGSPRMLDAEARSDVFLGSISLLRLEKLLDDLPGGWRALARLSEEWVALSSLAFADVVKPDKNRRAAAALLRLAGLRPPFCPLGDEAIMISQQEFAQMVNLSRSTTTTVLNDFVRAGWVQSGYRTLQVLNAVALAELADG
jgi:CRP/FNR family transcriptional regulator, cyclic AMP receptor protein